MKFYYFRKPRYSLVVLVLVLVALVVSIVAVMVVYASVAIVVLVIVAVVVLVAIFQNTTLILKKTSKQIRYILISSQIHNSMNIILK